MTHKDINNRQIVAILSILRDAIEPIGSVAIANEIHNYGFDLSGRTIRLYLQEMEKEGLVSSARRGRDGGRIITSRGLDEIRAASVKDRLGLTASKVDMLACQCTFDPNTRKGIIVINISLIDRPLIHSAVREMMPVFKAGLGMGEFVYIAHAGERVGEFIIPPGKIGIGTVCSVTINGILLHACIPTVSKFGGVLEFQDKQPVRFTDVIFYDGTSLDPLVVFIKGGLTSVRSAARTGNGRIGAGFREIPTVALKEAEQLFQKLHEIGLGGEMVVGRPHHSLLDFPVEEGRTGLIINGGLNPTAAIEEAGIQTENHALCTMFDFEKMMHYSEMPNVALEIDF